MMLATVGGDAFSSQYSLGKVLGEGAFAKVYIATSLATGETVPLISLTLFFISLFFFLLMVSLWFPYEGGSEGGGARDGQAERGAGRVPHYGQARK